MKYCSKCGSQIADEAAFCSNCGSPSNGGAPVSYPSLSVPGSSPVVVDTTGPMVLSILGFFCCLPLAIWSLILVIRAKDARTQEEADRMLGQAKTMNLINIGVGAVICVIAFLVGLASA